MNNPCINCVAPKRKPGCRRDCEEGREYWRVQDAKVAKVKELRRRDVELAMYKKERIYDTKKKSGLLR